jgi:hypothetical protein
VFEVVTYQINVLLLDEYRKGKKGEKSTGNNRPDCVTTTKRLGICVDIQPSLIFSVPYS